MRKAVVLPALMVALLAGTFPSSPAWASVALPVGAAPVPAVLYVDWRPDGLGTIAPRAASRPAPGDVVEFRRFEPLGVQPGHDSRFFFIKTSARNFGPGGTTTLYAVVPGGPSGRVVLATVKPVP